MTLNKLMTTDELISISVEIGRQMLISGAEIYRVEDALLRLCTAYGAADCQVYAVPTTIILTAARPGEKAITRMIRIYERGTDLRKLDGLNTLCRELCAQPQPMEEIRQRLEKINSKKGYSTFALCLASGGAAGFFALIFSHRISTGVVAFIIGICLRLVLSILAHFHVSRIFENMVGGFIIGSLSYAGYRLGFTVGYSGVIVGGIMPLIPGLLFTNSMRDIIAGDSIAGLTRFVETLLISTSIAVGVAIPLSIGRIFWGG